MHTDGHNMDKDKLSSDPQLDAHGHIIDIEHPGYEVEDVNTKGVAIFLTGLFITVLVFFAFCYGLGILINNGLKSHDGAASKWTIAAGAVPAGKGGNLTSNPEIEQKQLAQIVNTFPGPRLDVDDGNQATADLHAREDMLLDHYSRVDGQPDTIRIPIDRAMELIAQHGLPVETTVAATDNVAHAAKPEIQTPLTNGFARTGYELMTIEAREQKMNYGKAIASADAGPAK
jgi:hypothetical protein